MHLQKASKCCDPLARGGRWAGTGRCSEGIEWSWTHHRCRGTSDPDGRRAGEVVGRARGRSVCTGWRGESRESDQQPDTASEEVESVEPLLWRPLILVLKKSRGRSLMRMGWAFFPRRETTGIIVAAAMSTYGVTCCSDRAISALDMALYSPTRRRPPPASGPVGSCTLPPDAASSFYSELYDNHLHHHSIWLTSGHKAHNTRNAGDGNLGEYEHAAVSVVVKCHSKYLGGAISRPSRTRRALLPRRPKQIGGEATRPRPGFPTACRSSSPHDGYSF